MRTPHHSLALVGQQIRALREAAGLSQEDFAGRIDVDRSYYSHIERGRYNITLEMLFRIAQGLGCEPAELLPLRRQIGQLPPPPKSKGRRTPRK
ncbi:helix-turn-helix domain-containing protein [Solimonas soli]|uniref:helix-turn-helix domain-containing protein n=1 Tax=Solimonas soli TaxID=413479 RepID=UPI000484F9AF|nr:helix-turn-helix transcriptional regulator [Solimonas soli]